MRRIAECSQKNDFSDLRTFVSEYPTVSSTIPKFPGLGNAVSQEVIVFRIGELRPQLPMFV